MPVRRVLFVVVVSALVALVCAQLSVRGRELRVSAATTRVLVDLPRPAVPDLRSTASDFGSLTTRAELLGNLMSSDPVLRHIGRRAKLPPDQIAAIPVVTSEVDRVFREAGSEERAGRLLLAEKPYRLEVQAKPTLPVLDMYAQAPTTPEAERLANGAVTGLRDYLRGLARRQGFEPGAGVRLKQLGPARGGVISSRGGPKVAALTFLVAFALTACLLMLLMQLRRGPPGAPAFATEEGFDPPAAGVAVLGRPASPRGATLSPAAAIPGQPSLPLSPPAFGAPGAGALEGLRVPIERLRGIATHGGDWPNTTRVLPWMIAGFIAVLWLVPFDAIELNASMPVDMKLDRLLLPFLVVMWVLAFAVGGAARPRLRFTWVHAGVGLFVTVACLSVVFNAADLNRTLELDQSLKALPLLLAYLTLFLIVASSVRRTEVRPFLKYTLVLAVICAVGTIWEYRFQFNFFYELSDKLLPGFFNVGAAESSGVDSLGRRVIRGPAGHPLETVAMLAMALPIALAYAVHANDRRGRMLYGVAAGLLMAAMLTTDRKSALLVPLSVVLVVAYFRRRELLRLAPLAVPMLIVIQFVSPGALATVAHQFKPDSLGANTVSDRAADYDAVRPDLWTHFAFGRGWGSYQPPTHRVLDSEILARVVETGVVGLAAYALMMLCVVAAARAMIRKRHPTWAPIALAGAGAAVAFLVVSTLFDAMAFPHAPYIFLTSAAMLAAVLRPSEPEPGADPA
jgi:hypothetical protein